MSEEQDQSQKTEEASQKKLDDAREKGKSAESKELGHLAGLVTIGLVFATYIMYMATNVKGMLIPFFDFSELLFEKEGVRFNAITPILSSILVFLILILVTFMVTALLVNIVQRGFHPNVDNIVPKLERVSLLKGIKRLFSAKTAIEFIKNILKLSLTGSITMWIIYPILKKLPGIVSYEIQNIPEYLLEQVVIVVAVVASVHALITIIDYIYQRFSFLKQQRMSKQDLKDEYKQAEGDPHLKGRLRQIRQERSRRRMISKVPEADVIITNPTHYAIALRYEEGEMNAPRLIAKGVDEIAEKIREVAKQNNIPLVANPPLARTLHASVDLDQEIAPEHYKAVAEIINYVMLLKEKMRAY